jgi:hypothetical protein
MGKVKKFSPLNIRKITGGRDPLRIVEDFIIRQGFNPGECAKQKDAEMARWMLGIAENEELEILVEGLRHSSETTIYMGVNVATVPIRGAYDILAAALEIADGLVGIKLSLVGSFLVLSASLAASDISVEVLDYHYKLITLQQAWFREELSTELGWEISS